MEDNVTSDAVKDHRPGREGTGSASSSAWPRRWPSSWPWAACADTAPGRTIGSPWRVGRAVPPSQPEEGRGLVSDAARRGRHDGRVEDRREGREGR